VIRRLCARHLSAPSRRRCLGDGDRLWLGRLGRHRLKVDLEAELVAGTHVRQVVVGGGERPELEVDDVRGGAHREARLDLTTHGAQGVPFEFALRATHLLSHACFIRTEQGWVIYAIFKKFNHQMQSPIICILSNWHYQLK